MNNTTMTICISSQEEITITICPSGNSVLTSTIGRAIDNPSLNASLDAIESLVLAHASNGLIIDTPEYKQGVITALESIFNNE